MKNKVLSRRLNQGQICCLREEAEQINKDRPVHLTDEQKTDLAQWCFDGYVQFVYPDDDSVIANFLEHTRICVLCRQAVEAITEQTSADHYQGTGFPIDIPKLTDILGEVHPLNGLADWCD